DVTDVAEARRAREVADVDGVTGYVAGHDAANPDAAVDLTGCRIVVDPANRSRRQHERIGGRFEHVDLARAADEERDAAQLFGAAEERAKIAAQAHARVDQRLDVL